ncbi:MAG: hypothetical protein HYT80_00545 [Euryarchaeota archaeon]|nr:hypothetical protein [Euryarchaeota archaeon]
MKHGVTVSCDKCGLFLGWFTSERKANPLMHGHMAQSGHTAYLVQSEAN